MVLPKGPITFANLEIGRNSIYEIGAIGGHAGVLPEIAQSFGYDPFTHPVDLVSAVAPHDSLRHNIDFAKERLGPDGLSLARGWAERSGLLVPVARSFMPPEEAIPQSVDLAIITGGVRNWMERRQKRLQELHAAGTTIKAVLLAGSDCRTMNQAEGPDVQEDMTEASYLEKVIAPALTGIVADEDKVKVVRVPGLTGDEVARRLERHISDEQLNGYILVTANAGNWPQNTGQVRRGIRATVPEFDTEHGRLVVVSDGFALGETGNEPPITHQNPLSAVGMILRNVLELDRHRA
ncbi:MAG TPA: hypothetical protein VMY99_00490 [Nevskiaceae bacterium]|nr:hypothetical protein [Nevskiaceae bacterium]